MRTEVSDEARVRVDVTRTKDQEFTAFVHDAGPYLYKTALLLSGDAHRAEELVQATFERTYRSWHKARAGEPRAYARRILLNLRIDGWRRSRGEVVSDVVPTGSVAGPADGVAVRDEVVRALASLPLTQRRVVVLRHLLDLTEQQTARELGIAVGTVKSANARGIARLREIFEEGAR
ncbi:SigE family RNA polymerase sigma factor [Promicromonospora sukumoe]|uniref:SigE family RNA polymerase sigma factor n=1 Tax=Promicromonospora sukumoe TaxID=88382 RepID=UPI0003615764|nr:SigE family RNA polymerase sigma factor [Promicromonospora sukumoe]